MMIGLKSCSYEMVLERAEADASGIKCFGAASRFYIYIDGFSSNTLQALRQVQRPKEVGQKKYSNRKRSTLIIYSCDSCVMYAFLWSNLPFK